MAKSNAVWGIDLGQTALKALRCRPHEKEAGRIVADAFDYIEYPKILSQPEADRKELIAEALSTFVERNEIKGDQVAISVPGQMGLARFIKLPPVEQKKIPDIVKYEARQQIPFSLEEVVWDYQQLAGGSEEEGYALETEVGLFAMKRDQVGRSLAPIEDANIDVDYIQLAPLALYNFACFELLGELDPTKYSAEEPPESIVLISFGTDTTDLVVTNGFRVWQRNVPIGGNHFTKALSKELKLTFSKAEHLKRHATEADDPKAVFQAMRPVFSDLLAEIQRSIGYFASLDKRAKISRVVGLGNAMKLPGLQRYLSQNLDYKVEAIDGFHHLVGGSALSGSQFKDNLLSFAVTYGLCVQGLGKGEISTNLLPEEIVTGRLVREKKPWAIAAAAALLVGTSVNYVATWASWKTADVKRPEIKQAIDASKNYSQTAGAFTSSQSAVHTKFDELASLKQNLVSNVEGRLLWPELLKAVDAALPKDERPDLEKKTTAEDISQRDELHITKIDCQHYEDLNEWYERVKNMHAVDIAGGDEEVAEIAPAAPPPAEDAAAEGADPTAEGETPADGAATDETAAEPAPEEPPVDDIATDTYGGAEGEEEAEIPGPEGEGFVIELQGHHYHNGDQTNETAGFVRKTLIQNLLNGSVKLPVGGQLVDVRFSELGISHPTHVWGSRLNEINYTIGDKFALDQWLVEWQRKNPGKEPDENDPERPDVQEIKLKRYQFIVQFAWKPTPPSERAKKRAQELAETAALADDGSIQ